MIDELIVEPMTEDILLWRCLHSGPLTPKDLDTCPSDNQLDWNRYRMRNLPLLRKLTRLYGACAILALDGIRIVSMLRFYPKIVCESMNDGLCMQQDYPAGPPDNFVNQDFPTLAQLEEKTLTIHCLMTGCSQWPRNPYQRHGLGSRLVRTLIDWARSNQWQAIEASAFEDLPIIYEITGSAGQTFWTKLGFQLIDRYPHPYLQDQNDSFVATLKKQARAAGIPPDKATDKLVMRLELTNHKN